MNDRIKNKAVLNKTLAVLGMLLVCAPLVAPVGFAFVSLVRSRQFLLDYLMPAEFFPLVLLGGCLLLVALRERTRRILIGAGLGGAVLLLVIIQGLAVVTGLASGRTEPGGWQWALVLAALVGYILAVIATALGGALLLRGLFKGKANQASGLSDIVP